MRTAPWLFLVLVLLPACNRPSEAECQEALKNVRQIVEQNPNASVAPSMVEECRKNDSKKKVECHRAAKTSQDLYKCLEL